MSTQINLPEGAPEEVVTNALVRDVDLTPIWPQRISSANHAR